MNGDWRNRSRAILLGLFSRPSSYYEIRKKK
jgi:hypothetical protein